LNSSSDTYLPYVVNVFYTWGDYSVVPNNGFKTDYPVFYTWGDYSSVPNNGFKTDYLNDLTVTTGSFRDNC
jgi:hypothetical protein